MAHLYYAAERSSFDASMVSAAFRVPSRLMSSGAVLHRRCCWRGHLCGGLRCSPEPAEPLQNSQAEASAWSTGSAGHFISQLNILAQAISLR